MPKNYTYTRFMKMANKAVSSHKSSAESLQIYTKCSTHDEKTVVFIQQKRWYSYWVCKDQRSDGLCSNSEGSSENNTGAMLGGQNELIG